jgi:hypothetical protein
MLTPEQEANLKLFLNLIKADGQPDDEFLRDYAAEIAAYELSGHESQQRDRAVALYYHRARMMVIREHGEK